MSFALNISDTMNRLKNYNPESFSVCRVKKFKRVFDVLESLKQFGYVAYYEESKHSDYLVDVVVNIDSNGKNPIRSCVVTSLPSRKNFISAENLKSIVKKNKFKLVMISTSKGVLNGQAALKLGLGGELMFIV